MARTVNPVAYAARRDAFVDAAVRLIQEKGYEQLSIQGVIEAADASRGAFFHYGLWLNYLDDLLGAGRLLGAVKQ
jgi:AcrR family transcriptional regulator